jgi:hypothetical protein
MNDLLSDLIWIFHARENQISEHQWPQSSRHLLNARRQTKYSE